MISGDPDSLLLVCQETYRRVQDKGLAKVREIVDVFTECYQGERQLFVENSAFKQFGLTIDSFLEKQQSFTPGFVDRLLEAIDDPHADLGDVIIAGIDEEGGHLYTVSGIGIPHSWNAVGYVAIGSGEELAESAFMAAQYTPYHYWLETLVLTHDAKRRAEEAPGVGNSTDLWYTVPRSPYIYFEPASGLVSELDKTFEARLLTERTAVRADALAINEYLEAANARAKEQGQTGRQSGEGGVEGIKIESAQAEETPDEIEPQG